MTISRKAQLAELKSILEQVQSPSALDDHPWVRSLTAHAFAEAHPDLVDNGPGYVLLAALCDLFREMMPGSPPRQGKRLDNRWGEFGLLAAMYFAPFEFGAMRPVTLSDGWGRIDDEILRYVFERPRPTLPQQDVDRYRLVGNETHAAPVSTLSDWHLRGLDRLLDGLLNRERVLSARYGVPSVVLDPDVEPVTPSRHDPSHAWQARLARVYRQHRRHIWLGVGVLLALLLVWQGVSLYIRYRAFKADADQLQAYLDGPPSLDAMAQVGDLLSRTRADALSLQRQMRLWGWAGRLLGWLPIIGGDLASAEELVDMATALAVAGDEAYQGAAPLLAGFGADDAFSSIPETLAALTAAQDRFSVALQAANQALTSREAIDLPRLSPKTRALVERLDPYLPLLSDGLGLLNALPKILGASGYGPQTYLILIQNEDELRATGGFITAVAVVTVEQGEIISLQVDDSYAIDDLNKIYPLPPWQIVEYLQGGVWLLRDANWSPDFPTTATWAEYLYAIGRGHAVDGVFAIDQEALRLLLAAVGPVELPDAPEPISVENFIAYVRTARGPDEGETDWFASRKEFMGPLGRALLEKLQSDTQISWQAVGQAVLQALDERHILLQFDDPLMSQVISHRGWDGAVRPGEGDFLMVVDSNLGFNKVNAAVETTLRYEVDLSDPQAPRAEVWITHRNPTKGDEPCRHAAYDSGDYAALIARCYWDYLRVYTLAETELLDAATHEVPGSWLLSGKGVPPRVDVLDNQGLLDENPPGLRAYGTLLVVPLSEQRETRFVFALPPDVVQFDEAQGAMTYALRVKKQPGTQGNAFRLQVRLPAGAQVQSAVPSGDLQDGIWTLETRLRTDLEVKLVFSLP